MTISLIAVLLTSSTRACIWLLVTSSCTLMGVVETVGPVLARLNFMAKPSNTMRVQVSECANRIISLIDSRATTYSGELNETVPFRAISNS